MPNQIQPLTLNIMSSTNMVNSEPTATETQHPVHGLNQACTHDDNRFNEYNCPYCAARLEANLMEVHHEVMRRQGWTEEEIKAAPMRQFVTKPVIEILPDPWEPKVSERRSHGMKVLEEQNARFAAGRKWRAAWIQSGQAGQR